VFTDTMFPVAGSRSIRGDVAGCISGNGRPPPAAKLQIPSVEPFGLGLLDPVMAMAELWNIIVSKHSRSRSLDMTGEGWFVFCVDVSVGRTTAVDDLRPQTQTSSSVTVTVRSKEYCSMYYATVKKNEHELYSD
jgi:hypothetical protein